MNDSRGFTVSKQVTDFSSNIKYVNISVSGSIYKKKIDGWVISQKKCLGTANSVVL